MARKSDETKITELLGLSPLPPIDAPQSPVPALDSQIGDRVRDARKRSGISASTVAQAAGLTPDKLSKIENGKRRIAPRELPGLARALNVSLAWLLGRSEPGRSALALAHRVAARAGDDVSSALRARATELLEAEDRLERQARLPSSTQSPAGAGLTHRVRTDKSAYPDMPRTGPEAQRQGRSLARDVRSTLELGSTEIGDLPALIEMHFAADVALSPLGESSDGLCAHDAQAPDRAALLLVNSDFSKGRTRFTLAHELGHHLLLDAREVIEEDQNEMCGSGYVEQRVNSFAGHLLLPVNAVTAAVNWLDATAGDVVAETARGRLAMGYLMVRYGVSMPCTLRQLVEARVLTSEQKQELSRRLRPEDLVRAAAPLVGDKPGPDRPSRENRPPARLATAVIDAAREGRVGMHTVSVILGRPDDDQLYDEVMYAPEAQREPPREKTS